MLNRILATVALSCAFAFGSHPTRAAPLPYEEIAELPQGALEIGRAFAFVQEFGFDASSGDLWQRGALFPAPFYFGTDPFPPILGGSFEWRTRLDSSGNVVGPGSAVLLLDLGDGMRNYATGEVVDFGFGRGGCGPSGFCMYSLPSVTLHMTAIDAAILPLVGDWWQWIGFFSVSSPGGTPFLAQDYFCSPCSSFSHDDIVFHRVAEPPGAALAALAMVLALRALRTRGWPAGRPPRPGWPPRRCGLPG